MSQPRFSKDHEYIIVDGDVGTVGISEHAQAQLGDVVFVELPAIGDKVAKGAQAAVVESVKASGPGCNSRVEEAPRKAGFGASKKR